MTNLQDIPKNSKIYIQKKVYIFDHLDGMYSYCYNVINRADILHLNRFTPLVRHLDGYKISESPKVESKKLNEKLR